MAKAMGAPNDIIFMTLDGSFKPTLVPAVDENGLVTNAVVATPDGLFANPQPEPVKPVDPAPTGDVAHIFAIIAVLSVLGTAVVAKKAREN